MPKKEWNSKSESKCKNPKDKNYVQAQLMKLQKMDKEAEKKLKDKKEEIKNKDIIDIIEATKKTMQKEEVDEQREIAMVRREIRK